MELRQSEHLRGVESKDKTLDTCENQWYIILEQIIGETTLGLGRNLIFFTEEIKPYLIC